MAILCRCDQCAATYPQGQHAWIVVGHVLTEADAAQLDDDALDALEPSLHFCTWRCASEYTGARALVDQ
jgi:hypothetical protein